MKNATSTHAAGHSSFAVLHGATPAGGSQVTFNDELTYGSRRAAVHRNRAALLLISICPVVITAPGLTLANTHRYCSSRNKPSVLDIKKIYSC